MFGPAALAVPLIVMIAEKIAIAIPFIIPCFIHPPDSIG
jgi:hypothetical protein